MTLTSISDYEELNTFTGETETHTLYNIVTSFGNFDIEIIDKTYNGVVEIEAADWNIHILEKIYNHFDNTGDYELYLDNTGTYAYIDIETWGSPSDLDEILNEVSRIFEELERKGA